METKVRIVGVLVGGFLGGLLWVLVTSALYNWAHSIPALQ